MRKGLLIGLLALLLVSLLGNAALLWLQLGQRQEAKTPLEYDAESYEEVMALIEPGKPAILVFGADYCPTCVNYLPYVQQLHQEFGEDMVIRFVDTAAHPEVRKAFNIELIPSTLFFDRDGQPFTPEAELLHTDEVVTERKHISPDLEEVNGKDAAMHPAFEYGFTKEQELVYCKFVGLIDMLQLRQIAGQLLTQE